MITFAPGPLPFDGELLAFDRIVQRMAGHVPSEASLDEGMRAILSGSTFHLDNYARGKDALKRLRAGGASAAQVLEFLGALSVYTGRPHGDHLRFEPNLFAELVSTDDPQVLAWCRALCDRAAPLRDVLVPPVPLVCVVVGLAWVPIARAAAASGTTLDADALSWLTHHTPARALRAILGAVAEDARSEWIAACFEEIVTERQQFGEPYRQTASFVAIALRDLVPLLDLSWNARGRAAVERAIACVERRDDEWHEDPYPSFDALLADARSALEGRVPTVTPTRDMQQALAHLAPRYAVGRRASALPQVMRAAHGRAISIGDVPELASLARWAAAPPARKRAIATKLARALGKGFDAKESFVIHKPSATTFAIVPAHEAQIGLSDAEERTLRARLGAAAQPEDAAILERLERMRPVKMVRVGPLLASQVALSAKAIGKLGKNTITGGSAPASVEPHYVVDAIEKGPFRAPTDEEWEALARGGETGRLSMFGDELPTQVLLRSVLQQPLSRLNGFGLGGFGDLPEVVADAISPSELEGPRIVRGGARLLLPWQDVGEWHLMLHAVRSSQRAAPTLAFRAVLGVRTDGGEPATVATKTRSSSAKAKPRR